MIEQAEAQRLRQDLEAALYANAVMSKALRDFTDGNVSGEALKAWWNGTDTPVVKHGKLP